MSATDKKSVQPVKVYVRQRPFTQNEIELKRLNIVQELSPKEVTLRSGSIEKKYAFDGVFADYVPQSDVYEVVVFPLIDWVLSGYTCTVFAYGQTGTGKTYTMIGPDLTQNTDFDDNPSAGLVPRAALHLFHKLNELKVEYSVRVSSVEIYNEEIRDLLISDDGLPLRIYDDPDSKGATCIKGLTEWNVTNANEVYELLNLGSIKRHTAATNLNRNSSRSHTLFTIVVNTRETTSIGEQIIKIGKLHLIDLAGSENIGRSGATEMRAREAGTINKSLLTLGKVIKALAQKMQHVPYRESKLTRILQDSLGGKSKTCMIATYSPCIDAFDETVSTLDYAHVARSVANCPTVNINKTESHILKYSREEVAALRQELNAARAGEGFYMNTASYEKMTSDNKAKNERILYLVKQISHLEEHILTKQHEFDELNQSFQNTNTRVENLAKTLQEEEQKGQANQYVANVMNGKLVQLKENTKTLIDVVNSSTKHQDIYHKKYENQCSTSVNNANLARNIHVTATNALKEIYNSTENYVMNQTIHLDDAERKAQNIKENHDVNLEKVNKLISEIHSKSENFDVTFDSVFRDHSYNQNKISNYLTELYGLGDQMNLEKLQETHTNVTAIKDFLIEKTQDIKEKSAQTSASVGKAFSEDKKYTKKLKNLLDNLATSLQKRYDNLQRQKSHVKKSIELKASLLEVETSKRNDLLEECENLDQVDKVCNETLHTMRDSHTKHLEEAKKILKNFNQSMKPIESVIPLLDKAMEAIGENKAAYEAQIKSDKIKTEEYIKGVAQTFSKDLDYHKKEFKITFDSWGDQINSVGKSLVTATLDNAEHIERSIGEVVSLQNTYHSDLRQFKQRSTDTLENLGNSIVNEVHAGDTPEKPVHRFPKTIENTLSKEVLLQQFKNSMLSESNLQPNE